jgi:hypothetical protein
MFVLVGFNQCNFFLSSDYYYYSDDDDDYDNDYDIDDSDDVIAIVTILLTSSLHFECSSCFLGPSESIWQPRKHFQSLEELPQRHSLL